MDNEIGRTSTSSNFCMKHNLQGLSQDALESMISHFVNYCNTTKEKESVQTNSPSKSSNTICTWKGKEIISFFCREFKLLQSDSQQICNLFLYPFQIIKPVLWKPNKLIQQVELESKYYLSHNRSAIPILPYYSPCEKSKCTKESNNSSSPTSSEPPSPALPAIPSSETTPKKQQHVRTQSINHTTTICVVGCGHNIVAHSLIKYLVERNYKVKIVVDHVKYCKQIFAPLYSSLEESMIEFVEASLEKKKSFDHILAGVSCVILCDFPKHLLQEIYHGKSTCTTIAESLQKIVRNVMKSCMKQETITKLILLSNNFNCVQVPTGDRLYDIEDWNTSFDVHLNSFQPNLEKTYSHDIMVGKFHYATKLFEQFFYEYAYARRERVQFNICTVIVPEIVLAPLPTNMASHFEILNYNFFTCCHYLLSDLVVYKKFQKNGLPPISFGITAVEDVASCFVRLIQTPNSFGRYIVSSCHWTLCEFVKELNSLYETYHLNTDIVSKFKLNQSFSKNFTIFSKYLLKRFKSDPLMLEFYQENYLYSQMEAKQYEFILSHYAKEVIAYNNSRVTEELEVKFRPIRASLFVTCNSICQWKNLKDFETINKKKYSVFGSLTCESDFSEDVLKFEDGNPLEEEEITEQSEEADYSSSSSYGSPIGAKSWKRYEKKMLYDSFTSQVEDNAWVVIEKTSPTTPVSKK